MQTEQRKSHGSYVADRIASIVFLICAILIVVVIVGVFIFLGASSFRVFGEGGNVQQFFFSSNWDPSGATTDSGNPIFGAGGLILGTIVITIFSVIIATPLSFGMALFFTEMSPRPLSRVLQPLIEIFTGMPSVTIGFLGLVVLVPFLQKVVAPITGNSATGGFGWGAAILVLIVMIIPTITSVSIDALRAVPGNIREGSLALGSTRWQMMSRAVIPAATTGLATAVILGTARAVGETLAVALVLQGGSLPQKLFSLSVFFQPNINITQQIAENFGESDGAARDAYFTLAFILLVISFLCVCVSRYLSSRSVYK